MTRSPEVLATAVVSVMRGLRLTPSEVDYLVGLIGRAEAAGEMIGGPPPHGRILVPPGTASEIRKRIGH